MNTPSLPLATDVLEEKDKDGQNSRGAALSEASTSCPSSQSLTSSIALSTNVDLERQFFRPHFPSYGVAMPSGGPPDPGFDGDFGGPPRKFPRKLKPWPYATTGQSGLAFVALAVLPSGLFLCGMWLGLVSNTSMALSWGQSAILVATVKIPVTLCLWFLSAPWVSRRAWGLLCLLSSFSGCLVGIYANYHYMRSYDMYSLGAWYSDVWPMEHPIAWRDAVAVEFSQGAHLAVDKAGGYKADKVYCVAPVMPVESAPQEVGFWAVGTDCCEEHGKFTCGAAKMGSARGGLVVEQGNGLMGSNREVFEEAARQAAAQQHLKMLSPPVFLRWSSDLKHDMELLWQKAIGLVAYAAIAHVTCVIGVFTALSLWLMSMRYHMEARSST
mmetsp:Transcript_57113/g.105605  ORF Transcript_57113/g.105605 Transcript_57113/m.105605 type:complete len:384 (+) Transcript_57113:95-1246(+)